MARGSLRRIKRPCASFVEDAKKVWAANERFVVQEKSIRLLFDSLCPKHTNVAEVLVKVSVLNSFYHTNIYDTHAVAKHISSLAPGNRISAGDLAVVNDLARVRLGRKEWNFYSFASKYCSQHNPDDFPIFDSFVEKMLLHFRRMDRFAIFQKRDLREYPKFVDVIEQFRKFYGLEDFSLREVDRYLWFAGKQAFEPTVLKPSS